VLVEIFSKVSKVEEVVRDWGGAINVKGCLGTHKEMGGQTDYFP